MGGEDELQCVYNAVGSARKRIGRQNAHLSELPDGGGNADIPHEKITTVTEAAIPLTPKEQPVKSKTHEDTSHSASLVVTTIGPEQTKADQMIIDSATTIRTKSQEIEEIKPIAPIPDPGPSPFDAAEDNGPMKKNDRRNTTLNIENFIPATNDELFIPQMNQTIKLFECKE